MGLSLPTWASRDRPVARALPRCEWRSPPPRQLARLLRRNQCRRRPKPGTLLGVTDALRPAAADALPAWARRVRANHEQAERVREGVPSRDFYAPMAPRFRADPRRTDEPVLDLLRSLVVPGE